MNFLNKIFSAVLIIATLIFISSIVDIQSAFAASLSNISDKMSREKIGTLSTHFFKFKVPSGIALGTAGVTLSFPATTSTTFTITTPVIGDILAICHGPTTGFEWGTDTSTYCTSGGGGETAAAGSPAANKWGFTTSGTNPVLVVLAAPTTTWTHPVAVNDYVTVFISNAHFTNPANASTPTITITTTSDSGSLMVPIIDDDQVTVTATVAPAITFNIDTYNTAVTSTNTSAPYSVALGNLSTAAVTGTNETGSGPNGIWFDLATNASGGAIVTVLSANAALKSTAVPTDTIPSATATMVAGTANYGICANRNAATTGTLTKASPFNGTCTTTPAGNAVGIVTTTAQTIYTSTGAPIAGGRGEIMVDAAISGVTPAHTDYTDTLTFIATATF